ncbi:MAG: ribosome small subunit-dependent GTPase A [Gammaproteobacteria bacterium]
MHQPPFEAAVIAAFGRHVLVRDAASVVHKARPFGRGVAIVCGDRVRCERGGQGEIHVIEALPRRTALYRSSRRGASEAVCANLSLLLVVCAPRPQTDLFVVDRYLAAAASGGIDAKLVANKSDLGIDAELQRELGEYARAGFPTLECSVRESHGLDALIATCRDQTAVLVGQSGVGKSSLVRRMVPGAEAATGELVRETEGRHTTTASRLYDLPDGGHLIDSPGVRDFAPAIDRLEPRSLGFPDVEQRASECRFADCRHMREPDCAVRAAAESGTLHARRYESYRRLRRLYEELTTARGPGRG